MEEDSLFNRIIACINREKAIRRTKKIRLIVVLSSILLVALLVLTFSMGVLVGELVF